MAFLYISAAHKSSGKTTLTIGLCAALRRRGRIVQPFKKGPDYIDPLWLTAASGRDCTNLDFYTMGRQEIRQEFHARMGGADIGVIEGNKGLYDGLDLDGSNSNAALAELLGAPVVLVIDVRGMTRGIAPLLLGYSRFGPGLRFGGVILNQVGGSRHEAKLREVVGHYTELPVIGAVQSDDAMRIEERHLGLMPSNEADRAQGQIELLATRVEQQVDLDLLERVAANAAPLLGEAQPVRSYRAGSKVRIGYARDRAFGFYYAGDLQALEGQGAELLPFDTLRDPELPDVDGLLFGGGFPETAMEGLEANRSLREQIRCFIEAGGPAYAECGGLMYLSRSLNWNGKSCRMVGVIPADTVMHDRPQGRGYVRLRENGNSPWPMLAQQPEEIAAHEFHYSALENLAPGLKFAYEVVRGWGIDGQHDGIVYKNLLASYTHLRDSGDNRWTTRFLQHVRATAGRTL